MSEIKRIDCRTRIDCPNHGVKFGYCEECLFPAPPAPQGSGEHKLVDGLKQELPPRPETIDVPRGNGNDEDGYWAYDVDPYIAALESQSAALRATLAEVEAARDQALTLGAEQVLEIQELRQVVTSILECTADPNGPHGNRIECYAISGLGSFLVEASALLESKAKPTQQGDKE
jgi:hypothetical protein